MHERQRLLVNPHPNTSPPTRLYHKTLRCTHRLKGAHFRVQSLAQLPAVLRDAGVPRLWRRLIRVASPSGGPGTPTPTAPTVIAGHVEGGGIVGQGPPSVTVPAPLALDGAVPLPLPLSGAQPLNEIWLEGKRISHETWLR